MAHLRQQIREAVKAALLGLAPTGDRVFTGRTRPLGAQHADTILIYTESETSSRSFNGVPPLNDRPLSLFVEVRIVRAEPPDDDLDTIAALIEAAMWNNRTLGGLVRNMQYAGAEQRTDASGESHVGGIRLEYRPLYRVAEGAPTENVSV